MAGDPPELRPFMRTPAPYSPPAGAAWSRSSRTAASPRSGPSAPPASPSPPAECTYHSHPAGRCPAGAGSQHGLDTDTERGREGEREREREREIVSQGRQEILFTLSLNEHMRRHEKRLIQISLTLSVCLMTEKRPPDFCCNTTHTWLLLC